jgi:hypothetical protein
MPSFFISSQELLDANLLIEYYLNEEIDENRNNVPNYYYWKNLMRAVQRVCSKGYLFFIETLPNGTHIVNFSTADYSSLGSCKSRNLQFATFIALLNFINTQV